MQSRLPSTAALASLLVLAAAGGAIAQPNYRTGQWIAGRATFYGGTEALKQAYSMRPGADVDDSYGVIEFGSCGFTNSDGTLAYGQDMYAALADTNWDYSGSCGRCYEVRCRSGLVQDRGAPVSTAKFFDMGKANPNFIDSQGRSWPGNERQDEDLQDVQCWNDTRSIVVKVGDSCPCQQKKPDGSVQPQFWCCGGANHMDLSYWAFEKLAHPTYGVIGVEYRPVDCVTRQALPPVPGYVAPFIYANGDLGSGWGWMPYRSKNARIKTPGEGRTGGAATCLTASKEGAIKFNVKGRTGMFIEGGRLVLWLKSNTKSLSPYASSTPAGLPPNLKIFLMNDEKKLYCGREIYTGSLDPTDQSGDYFKFEIPLSLFQCGEGSSAKSVANINRIDMMNMALRDADFCIDYLAVLAGPPSVPVTLKPTMPAEEAPADDADADAAPAPAPPARAPTLPAPARAPTLPVSAPRTGAGAPRRAPALVPVPAPAGAPLAAPPPPAPRAGWFPFMFPTGRRRA